jgi:glycosyltransferase involved in cell wall biosynthesis
MVGLLLAIRLAFLRRASTAWRCKQCGLRARARLRPAVPPIPAVAIPTYNNAETIAGVVASVRAVAPDLPLIVIDDGSTDGTGDRARQAIQEAGGIAPATVRTHSKNHGKGVAIRTALRMALARGYSHVITLDGDGQHLAADIRSLRDAIEKDPTALWVGHRDLSGANVESSSRFGRSFSNFWLRALGRAKLADSQSGFRAYPVAPVLSLDTRARAFDFEVEALTLGARAGIPLDSVPIGVHYPPPEARVSHFDKLWDNVRISLLTRACC